MSASKPFVCVGEAHHRLPREFAQCPICGEPVVKWSPVTSESEKATTPSVDVSSIPVAHAHDVSNVSTSRTSSGFAEFDSVLGGGFVPGEVVLLAGTPGAGKSTLLAGIAENIADGGGRVLYLSGEESVEQIALRHRRVHADADGIDIVATSDASVAKSFIAVGEYDLVIIDSIQTLRSSEGLSMMDIAYSLCESAHASATPTIMVGHFTKASEVGGPMTLIHAVDAVLTFTPFGTDGLRILRAEKNRFGDVSATACFRHEDDGLVEVPDPSGISGSRSASELIGIGPTVMMEGTKAIVAEVQSLIVPAMSQSPQFAVQGITSAKARIVLAALSRVGVDVIGSDVFIDIGGNIRTRDSGIDLAVAASMASASMNVPVSVDAAFIGEILLTGEVRAASSSKVRAAMAHKLGMTTVGVGDDADIRVGSVRELVNYLGRR